MLQDSQEMAMQALRRLGYLDDSWNADFPEALSCFWNATHNKKVLRKLGLLTDPFETTSAAAEKLKIALLSDNSDGRWQRGGTHTPAVVNALRSRNLLPGKCESPLPMDEMWRAMKTYARTHQLPKVKTFNALAAHIAQHESKHDPHRRGNIFIKA